MKKITPIGLILFLLLVFTACGKNTTPKESDYNMTTLKTALGNGEKLEGKSVAFKIEKKSQHILSRDYSLYTGNDKEFDFTSKNDPKVSKGNTVIVKIESVSESLGKYKISYSDLSKIKSLSDVRIKNEKVKRQELALDIPDNQTANEDGKIEVKGTTSLPNAQVTIGMGIIGDHTTSNKKGEFVLSYDILGSLKTDTIEVTAALGDKKVTKIVKLKQNPKLIASYEADQAKKADSTPSETPSEAPSAAPQEKEKPAVVPIQLSFAELMNKLNNNQLVDGEVYAFTADVVAKKGKNYPEYGSDRLNNRFVRLADPNDITSNTPFYANDIEVSNAVTSSKGSLNFTVKIVNVAASDDSEGVSPTFLITAINGKKLDTSGFKAK
ncbi:hypothetical protein GYQ39_09870 [Lactococcus piscium]|uniref:hypothetical protein n=1 Tax=Pseudolactococcus carnosus TaxID=2749961 RepID=UPI001FBB5A6F|nr:hypothetical protein [Lactococcus carnosus]MCJ2001215.1 hypothetical protein [Lactococcus carnosus]